MTTKREHLEDELTELERVGSQPFGSYLRPELVEFNPTVFDRALTPDEVRTLAEKAPDFVQDDGTAIYTTP